MAAIQALMASPLDPRFESRLVGDVCLAFFAPGPALPDEFATVQALVLRAIQALAAAAMPDYSLLDSFCHVLLISTFKRITDQLLPPFDFLLRRLTDGRALTDKVIGMMLDLGTPDMHSAWVERIMAIAREAVRIAVRRKTEEALAEAAGALAAINRLQRSGVAVAAIDSRKTLAEFAALISPLEGSDANAAAFTLSCWLT
jgi:hypothetical protein